MLNDSLASTHSNNISASDKLGAPIQLISHAPKRSDNAARGDEKPQFTSKVNEDLAPLSNKVKTSAKSLRAELYAWRRAARLEIYQVDKREPSEYATKQTTRTVDFAEVLCSASDELGAPIQLISRAPKRSDNAARDGEKPQFTSKVNEDFEPLSNNVSASDELGAPIQ